MSFRFKIKKTFPSIVGIPANAYIINFIIVFLGYLVRKFIRFVFIESCKSIRFKAYKTRKKSENLQKNYQFYDSN